MKGLKGDKNVNKKVVGFVKVGGWVGEGGEEVEEGVKKKEEDYRSGLEVGLMREWVEKMREEEVVEMVK